MNNSVWEKPLGVHIPFFLTIVYLLFLERSFHLKLAMKTEQPTLLIGLLCYSNNAIVLLVDQVTLLAHQRRALAWLLWREAQNPCGGILGMFVFFIFT